MTESFGKRVRRLRQEQSYTVSEAAVKCGVSDSTIRQIESGGVRMPSFSVGVRLADSFNVDPHYLLNGGGPMSIWDELEAPKRRLDALEKRPLN
jgi:transcriptional regulator with XRE-family HTH domain